MLLNVTHYPSDSKNMATASYTHSTTAITGDEADQCESSGNERWMQTSKYGAETTSERRVLIKHVMTRVHAADRYWLRKLQQNKDVHRYGRGQWSVLVTVWEHTVFCVSSLLFLPDLTVVEMALSRGGCINWTAEEGKNRERRLRVWKTTTCDRPKERIIDMWSILHHFRLLPVLYSC